MTSLHEAAADLMTTVEFAIKSGDWKVDGACDPTIDLVRLREALAEPEQEPLGGEWVPCVKLPVIVHVRNQRDGENHISTREGITPVLPEDLIMRGVAGEEYPIGRELFERTYTFDIASSKREWVGLTHEERDEIDQTCRSQMQALFAVEEALRQKNGFSSTSE